MLEPVARLLACRFCRQIFPSGETDGTCPDCGVRLEPLEKLPPSLDALAEEVPVQPVPPDDRRLPWTHIGRGRAVLTLLALLGLATFFMPWIRLHSPVDDSWTGFQLARHRLGWMWGGAVGWFVMLPLVLSRRSVRQMRGVRVILCVFAAMTLVEVIVLVSVSPGAGRLVTPDFSWGAGLYRSALASAAGVWVGARFGGPTETGQTAAEPRGVARQGPPSSHGETLH